MVLVLSLNLTGYDDLYIKKSNGRSLYYASEEFQRDPEFALIALAQNKYALLHTKMKIETMYNYTFNFIEAYNIYTYFNNLIKSKMKLEILDIDGPHHDLIKEYLNVPSDIKLGIINKAYNNMKITYDNFFNKLSKN